MNEINQFEVGKIYKTTHFYCKDVYTMEVVSRTARTMFVKINSENPVKVKVEHRRGWNCESITISSMIAFLSC